MCCFYSVVSPVAILIDIINYLYDEDQLNVSIVNLNTFANLLYIKKIIKDYT